MRKIGLTIAAAAAVLTSFVAPVTQDANRNEDFEIRLAHGDAKGKGLRQFRFRSERFAERQRLRFPRERLQGGEGSASQGNGSPNSRRVIILIRPVPVRPIFVRRVFMGPVL